MSESDRRERSSSPEVQLRRFFREVQQSDLMTEIKRRRYFEKKPSRNARRSSAHGKEIRRQEKRGY
ncbi:MAG: 30S ribosomal protein S21 [Patescibacteria group bacterium]